MKVDGARVEASYDSSRHLLSYVPSDTLSAGEHTVTCKVVIDNDFPITKQWKFSVTNDAKADIPHASDSQQAIVREINEFRRSLHLEDFLCHDALSAAAAAHVNYLRLTNSTGHYEKPGLPGFVGQDPTDRLQAFGYVDGSWEDVDYGADSPREALKNLFDAPYHRIPFMQPGQLSCGAAWAENRLAIEFQMTDDSATVVSPYPGQTGVPTVWHGRERPNPLRLWKTDGTVGYMIVFNHFTPNQERLIVHRAALTGPDGSTVPVFLNTPDNDEHLAYSALVIPQQALRPGAKYTVTVDAQTEGGADVSKTWSFRTRS
jgi:hypothetical protein